MAQSARAITAQGDTRLRRVLALSIEGQGAQDPTAAQRKAVGGIVSILGLVTGNQIDRHDFETLITVRRQLQETARALRKARCALGKMVDRAPCGDVQATLIHVALVNMPPGSERTKLLAIPTGLTISGADTDLLVAAGRSAIETSTPLRRFLADYAVAATSPSVLRVAHQIARVHSGR